MKRAYDRKHAARPVPKARQEPARPVPAQPAGPVGLKARGADLLELQRLAGNASVTALVRPPVPSGDAPITVQRHDSFEHRLLGDASPEQIKVMSGGGSKADRARALKDEAERLTIWQRHPETVTEEEVKQRWPNVRVLTVNGLVVTYGELNTLGDYFANPQAIRSAPRGMLLSILQSVRQESYNRLSDFAESARMFPRDQSDYHERFKGAIANAGETGTLAAVSQVSELNAVTASLGTNQYQSLVSRNACHFAPFNWGRWQEFHLVARDLAKQAHVEADPARKRELVTEAWLNNGYADHFLQDSFASGHLVNKTLIMQWFVEYIEAWNSKWYHKNVNLENWDQIKTMTVAQQPGLAATNRYQGQATSTDPQTAEEQGSRQDRMEAAGVQGRDAKARETAYHNYLAFLNSAAVQKASGDIHDHFNEKGIEVSSPAHPKAYRLYGDSSLLLHTDGADGGKIAGETAHLSQRAIQETLDSNDTRLKVTDISDSFPTTVHIDGKPLSLADWQVELRRQCFDDLFGTFMHRVIDEFGPRMGNVSVDAAAAAPGTFEAGDTVIRDWAKAHDAASIDRQPLAEKLRMLNRLLNGWVSDGDVEAVEKICGSVSSPQEMAEIYSTVEPRLLSLTNLGQRTRVQIAIMRKPAALVPAR